MFLFLLLVLGVSCILPVCSGLPFKLPFSNISLCFCLSKKNKKLGESFGSYNVLKITWE